jgi:Ca2+-binding EF-hand superfamily protein
MGCSSSRYVVDINTEGQGIDCQRILKLLKLSDSEVNRLYRCFLKYDLSNDGKLSILEFLTMLDIGMISFLSELRVLLSLH